MHVYIGEMFQVEHTSNCHTLLVCYAGAGKHGSTQNWNIEYPLFKLMLMSTPQVLVTCCNLCKLACGRACPAELCIVADQLY